MNQHTKAAREWLDRRYSRTAQGGYLAHQPIEGLRTRCSEPNAVLRLARTFRLLQVFDHLEFESFLDVGGGEGYMAALVRDLCGPAVAHSTDLSSQACHRGGELFGIQGIASDISRLPLADKSYDVVLCSEVIEHLSAPVLAISELVRIARKYVIISTAEFCPLGEIERRLRLATLDASYPHAEVNWFTPRDFRMLLGSGVTMSSQFQGDEAAMASGPLDRPAVEQQLAGMTNSFVIDVDHVGVIALCPQPGAELPVVWVPAPAARTRRILDRLLDPPLRAAETLAPDQLLRDPGLVDRIRCLLCTGALTAGPAQLFCSRCGHSYQVEAGVPSMFVEGREPVSASDAIEEAVARLAAADPDRGAAIRRLVERLHPVAPRDNGRLRRWMATQLLRILWLIGRDEPAAGKRRRVFRRLGRRPRTGTAPSPTVHAPVPAVRAAQGDSVSGR